MTTNDPTTEQIVQALRCDGDANNCVDCRYATYDTATILCDQEQNVRDAADRLESLEQKLELLNGGDFDVIDIPAALAYLESVEEILPHASALIDLIQSLKGTAIELTARAEQAELERDAAVVDMKSIVDAVREEYIDGTCCFACKYDFDTSCDEYGCCPGECPGFESNDCFEWRGLPQEGEGL